MGNTGLGGMMAWFCVTSFHIPCFLTAERETVLKLYGNRWMSWLGLEVTLEVICSNHLLSAGIVTSGILNRWPSSLCLNTSITSQICFNTEQQRFALCCASLNTLYSFAGSTASVFSSDYIASNVTHWFSSDWKCFRKKIFFCGAPW